MRRGAVALVALAALASCPRVDRPAATVEAPDLETAAILRGLVRDPKDVDPAGLYARDTDRLCVVHDAGEFRVGAYVDYGDDLGCNAAGSARRVGDRLSIDLGNGCTFDAEFDGDRVTFPAILPRGCARSCSPRATLAALDVRRLSDSEGEARAMRAGNRRRLCA